MKTIAIKTGNEETITVEFTKREAATAYYWLEEARKATIEQIAAPDARTRRFIGRHPEALIELIREEKAMRQATGKIIRAITGAEDGLEDEIRKLMEEE